LFRLEQARILRLMEFRTSMSLLLLFAFTSGTPAQTPPLASAGKGNAVQQTQPGPATYGDTLRMLKTWWDSPKIRKSGDLARLFAMGNARASDLRAACESKDDRVASAAFLLLQLLGKSGCVDCGNSISRKRGTAFACEPNLADVDLKRVEKWLDKKRTQTGYDCGDDSELQAPVHDSLVYALILDGSPRSKSILDRLLAMGKACAWENAIAEPLEEAESLIATAKEIGHDLRFEPDTLESAIRASAFFLSPQYRKDSHIELIARNKTGNRILLEVRYICGLECGRGYLVVLRKEGSTWQYAVVTMAWIA